MNIGHVQADSSAAIKNAASSYCHTVYFIEFIAFAQQGSQRTDNAENASKKKDEPGSTFAATQ